MIDQYKPVDITYNLCQLDNFLSISVYLENLGQPVSDAESDVHKAAFGNLLNSALNILDYLFLTKIRLVYL